MESSTALLAHARTPLLGMDTLLEHAKIARAMGTGTGLLGFDASHYQGPINWAAVKAAGFGFCYAKVLEGLDFPDPTWPANRAGSAAIGIPMAGYHWAHPNLNPQQCAAKFLQLLNQVPGMLQPIVDIEHNGNPTTQPTAAGGRSPAQIHDWLHEFRAPVHSHAAGLRLDTYTGGWFWDAYVAGAGCAECAASRLYLSRYASTMGPVPAPWTKASVWQFTETGHMPGIAGLVDEDRLVGDELLADLIWSGTVPDPTNGEDLPVDQNEFNELMDGYYKAKPAALRVSLDEYFRTRIPDPAHPTPGSISERLAGRTFAVISNPKVDGSLSSINSKIAKLPKSVDLAARAEDAAPAEQIPGVDVEVAAWPPMTEDAAGE